jgi:hypothetical protein
MKKLQGLLVLGNLLGRLLMGKGLPQEEKDVTGVWTSFSF